MSQSELETDGFWPTAVHAALLRAALADKTAAVAGWKRWQELTGYTDYEQVDFSCSRLLPAVYCNFVRHGIDDRWLPKIRGLYRYTWTRNMLRRNEVLQVIRELNAQQVRCLLLKGEALVLSDCFENAGARPMIDTDLLVAKSDLPAATAVLKSLGWMPRAEQMPPHLRHTETWRSPQGFELDLHFQLLPQPFREVALDVAARDAITRSVSGIDVLVQQPAELLLHLCVHGRIHAASGMPPFLWVADVHHLLATYGVKLDWSRLLQLATDYEMLLPVRDALGYMQREFDSAVPADWLAEARSRPLTAQGVRQFLRYCGLTAIPRSLGDLYRREVEAFLVHPCPSFSQFLAHRWILKVAQPVRVDWYRWRIEGHEALRQRISLRSDVQALLDETRRPRKVA